MTVVIVGIGSDVRIARLIAELEEELLRGEIGRVDGFRIVGSSYQIPAMQEPYLQAEPRKKKAQWKTERQRWSKR